MSEKSLLSIVKCDNYAFEAVNSSLRRAIGLLGGIDKFVKKGERVLVKPNVLSGRKPEDAVCTNPEVVRAITRLLKEVGASVIIGDSPGGFLKNLDRVYEVSGMKQVASDEGVDLVKFTSVRNVEGFPLSTHVLEADKIISVPKFKTHEITGITAGVKNMYGAVVGIFKAQCHAKAPREEQLAKVLAKVFLLTKPSLTILDAIWSMEGEGPSAGIPRKTSFIMAGSDAVAIDALLAILIGHNPLDFAVTRECRNLGLGQTDTVHIDIAGDNISDFEIKDFKMPRGGFLLKSMPQVVTNFIGSLLKLWPQIESDKCRKCDLCRTSCPVNAININEDHIYKINLHKCIKCMCCHEVCPYSAIRIRKNWLARLLWR